MKRMLILFQFFVLNKANAQNEFAATAFYNEFNKIYADAQTGFLICKGTKRKSEFEELATEYRAKLMLPLADSGKLVVPVTGNPYAIYYFEPDKIRLKVDQRGVNLRDAIVTAFGKPLYARTETTIINNYPFTSTLFFTDPGESLFSAALFRQCIYYKDGSYFLSFEIRGKNQ
ncbi:MAG: hypothetical protein V9F01_01750 [Chitinophagaceae bacterium]